MPINTGIIKCSSELEATVRGVLGPYMDRFEEASLVGSRATCNPAPTNTDIDILVLALDAPSFVDDAMAKEGWEWGGSFDTEENESPFFSLKGGLNNKEDINLIVTDDPDFYNRVIAATAFAKHMNLLDKRDRIRLFQAVLYGKVCDKFDQEIGSIP